MTRFLVPLYLLSVWSVLLPEAHARSREELARRFKALPTVPESDLPDLRNQPTAFPGIVEMEGLEGSTWVRFPFVENPGSFGIDFQGRIYVVEANRFWLGVPDLRGANELIRGDFQAVTTQDRLELYEDHSERFPEGWFNAVADRVVRLEDRDKNGAADHRTLFSDQFNGTLDGLAFSILPEEDAVFFTCIPNVWKLTDEDQDGVADRHETVAEGFGVRVSFLGHDLHGIIRGPDGRLYFSVGDRGYHVETREGEVLANPGRGAVFRCESDGSGLEEVCVGLRNPQELAFDDYGNLFTFDNTGDIGDLARMVYVLEGTDSGWDMAHQSAHQYRENLDWGPFHPEKSMWVEERMYDLFHEEQPQWVYPPASHVARGPSGVTWLTGNSLPGKLRNRFLLANYRGASDNCTVLLIGVKPEGAGYVAESEEVLVRGVGVSDVELGYDGRIYLCDFGGGWSVNENGAVHVLSPRDEVAGKAGREVAELMAAGFGNHGLEKLEELLGHADRRVRQRAQFEIVARGDEGATRLREVAADTAAPLKTRLHAIWGLGQLGRQRSETGSVLEKLAADGEMEVRANVARVLGDLGSPSSRPLLLELLRDESSRVESLAAIALGRVGPRGEEALIAALFERARVNGNQGPDLVVRHALLTALDRLGTQDAAAKRVDSDSEEERLLAVLFLRRHESEKIASFWNDPSPVIRREVIRAIYDTSLVDGEAGERLARLGAEAAAFGKPLQRRVVAANFRRGQASHAKRLVRMAGAESLARPTRLAALHGLLAWSEGMVTDPVLGHYRPLVNPSRTDGELGAAIDETLRAFLAVEEDPEQVSLAMKLADKAGVELDAGTLRAQVVNASLDASVRAATLDSLVGSRAEGSRALVRTLLQDSADDVRVSAMRHAFALGLDGMRERAEDAIREGRPAVARAAIAGLGETDAETLIPWWNQRESKLRKALWLDVFLALRESGLPEAEQAAARYAAANPYNVFRLSETGGDPRRGEAVFRNQGACLQCHKVGNEGGIQGPDLTRVGDRLTPAQLLESIYNPGAVITEGYGSSNVTLRDGSVVFGRVAREDENGITLIGLDGKETTVQRKQIESVTPPVSAMPPVAAMLPPGDLRDLAAYLSQQKGGKKRARGKDAAKHGDDEKIAK